MTKKYYKDTNKTKLDIDGTAVNSDKLGEIDAVNYYHTGNLPPAQNPTTNPINFNASDVSALGVRITTPFKPADEIMISFTVRAFLAYNPVDIQFSGWMDSSTGKWNRHDAVYIAGDDPVTIAMGVASDGYCYVWISGPSDYAGVSVFNVTLGLNGGDASSGWKIERTDDTPNYQRRHLISPAYSPDNPIPSTVLSDPTTQQAIDDLKAAGVNNDTMTAATFIDLQTPGDANQKTKAMKEIIDEVAEQYSLEFEFLVSKVLAS